MPPTSNPRFLTLLACAAALAGCRAAGPSAEAAPATAQPEVAAAKGEPVGPVAATKPATSTVGPALPPPTGAEPTNEQALRGLAIAAIERGDFVGARDLVEQMIVGSRVAEANALLDADRPEEALSLLEDVRREAPGRVDALLPFGEASLRTGESIGEVVLVERAFAAFAQVGADPAGALGASRAARALGRGDDALRYAREAIATLDARGDDDAIPPRAFELPELTFARAVIDAHDRARAEQSPQVAELAAEAEDALGRVLGQDATDPWAWKQAARLFLADQKFEQASNACEQGLHRVPEDADLPGWLASAAFQHGGNDRVIATFDRVRAAHPEMALAWWFGARARFDRALANLDAKPASEFELAERDFARCRELEPGHGEACRGMEAASRNARGWCAYSAGDVATAERTFLSLEQIFQGAIARPFEDKLPSGLQGLELVARTYNEAKQLGRAAAIFDRLHELAPESVDYANNAGFFNRDFATELEVDADALDRAAKGEETSLERLATLRDLAGVEPALAGTPAERERFASAAADFERRARDHYEASYRAYARAAELAPEDVRVLNDTALLLIYHLERDWDRAKDLLERAVAQGEIQIARTDLTKDQRFELENAWGDAHENLGVYHLEHAHDPKTARGFFERALQIGPDPRPVIVDHWLPRCDQALEKP